MNRLLELFRALKPLKVIANVASEAQNSQLDGLCIIVTGGGTGIGFATSKAFIFASATVVAVGRRADKLEAARNELGEKYIPYVCDVTDIDRIPEHMDNILKLVGKVDILVNCAGIFLGSSNTFFTCTPEQYDKTIDTNLKAMYFWSQKVGKYFIESGIKGDIVNVTSIFGIVGEACPYGVSKWGVTGLTMELARLLSPYGIHVNAVAPGSTVSEIGLTKDKVDKKALTKRFSEAEEIANTIQMLVTNRLCSGEVIVCDGGTIL